MILTSSYTKVWAAQDETFLGWKHFVHELNTFLNKNVTKDTHGLEYVTLGNSDDLLVSPDQATLEVFIGETGPLDYDPQKLISGTRYFLGEHGLKIEDSELDDDSWRIVVSGLSQYEHPESHKNMKNNWMRQNLLSGRIIDVRETGVEVEPGVFKLSSYVPNTTYVDSEEEAFIFSIGKDLQSGEILAAYDTRFYNNDDYETLYLH